MKFNWLLMKNNITKDDLDVLIDFLTTNPRLTLSENVRQFEEECQIVFLCEKLNNIW